METKLNFLPRTLNIRQFKVEHTDDFFFVTGTDKCFRRFYVLTIRKVEDTKQGYSLKDILIENRREYDNSSYMEHLQSRKDRCGMIGLPIVKKAYGILGFIRFLKGYYLVLVTKRQRVAKILRHSIYTIKDIQLLPLFTNTSSQNKEDEAKYLNYF